MTTSRRRAAGNRVREPRPTGRAAVDVALRAAGAPWVRGLAGMSLLAVVGAVVAAETVHHLASRSYLGQDAESRLDAREAVVVLGHADAGRAAGRVNRQRVAYALRSRRGGRSTLILSGGAVAGPVAEAELLADHARALGYRGPMLTETSSSSTWDNVAKVIPLLEDAERIVVVSDAVHGAKARLFLHRQRPDLAARLARADDHRLGEDLVHKPATALLGLIDLCLSRRHPGWARDALNVVSLCRRLSLPQDRGLSQD